MALLSGSETILVVENQQAVRLLLTQVLVDYGYKLLRASTGQETLLLGRHTRSHPHPRHRHRHVADDRPALAERLRRQSPSLRVLFMSGDAEGTVLPTFLAVPGTGFIQKPILPMESEKKLPDLLDPAK